jgi:hypothetical protein
MSKKAVLRTAQDIFVLDKAFFLIEGHPSSFLGTGGQSIAWKASQFNGIGVLPGYFDR